MSALRARLERWTDTVLDGIRRHPEMYGAPDAVEAQALLLLVVREIVSARDADSDPSHALLRAWRAHVQQQLGPLGSTPLAMRLATQHPDDPDAQFATLRAVLAPFVRERLGDLPHESPFVSNDLALVVRMRRQKPLPTASRVGALLGLVGQVMRSVVRPGRGRLRRDVEDATTIRPAGSVEIVPENGIGAQIVMPLAWPQRVQTSLPEVDDVEGRVRETFARFIDVAAWAAASVDPIERLVDAVPDSALRTRMALDAVRLVPAASGAIEAIEIGGRAIGRTVPLSLRSEARARLVTVVGHETPPSPFDALGVMRMVDLDEGRLRLKLQGGAEAVEVWLPDAEWAQSVATLLGSEVRVQGQRFARPGGRDFVLADTLERHDADTTD